MSDRSVSMQKKQGEKRFFNFGDRSGIRNIAWLFPYEASKAYGAYVFMAVPTGLYFYGFFRGSRESIAVMTQPYHNGGTAVT